MNIQIFIVLLLVIPVSQMGCTSTEKTGDHTLDCVPLNIDQLSDNEQSTKQVWQTLNAHHRNATNRNLVIFHDGTGNTRKSDTNIWEMYKLAVQNSCNQPLVPYYRRGLGTNFGQLLFGKLTGWGMDNAIKEGYKFLVETYQPGDKIFLFGFSRGAYIARSLNGMMEYVGLLNREKLTEQQEDNLNAIVHDLYTYYHHLNDGKPKFSKRLYQIIVDKIKINYGSLPLYKNEQKVIATAIGVFDTVPALGLGRDDFPDDHRTNLYAIEGYQALAIDEQRDDFRPLRFNDEVGPEKHVEEVWFAGAHSDVGGGYKSSGLESVPRQWMLEKFVKFKIFPNTKMLCNDHDAVCERGELHDEFLDKSMFRTFGLHWRKPTCNDTVHASVLCRLNIDKLPKPNPVKEPGWHYQPENLYSCLKASYNFIPKDYRCANGESPFALLEQKLEQKRVCPGPCGNSGNACN